MKILKSLLLFAGAVAVVAMLQLYFRLSIEAERRGQEAQQRAAPVTVTAERRGDVVTFIASHDGGVESDRALGKAYGEWFQAHPGLESRSVVTLTHESGGKEDRRTWTSSLIVTTGPKVQQKGGKIADNE